MGGRRNVAIAETGPLGGPPPPRQEQLWRKVWRIEALSNQDSRCAYCREPLTVRTSTADHVVPISNGGRTERTNIAAACRDCNHTKRSMPAEKFKRLLRSREPTDNLYLALARFRFRLWSRVDKAEKRILQSVGKAAA